MQKTNEVLWKEYKDEGCEASRIELIQNNKGLVISCAKNWQYAYGAKNIEFEDLCGEGQEGLLEAIETYNPDKGTQFSTHATNLISASMQQYVLKNARHIAYPEEKLRTINRINKCRPEGDAPDLFDWYEAFVEQNNATITFEKFKSLVKLELELGICSSLNELLGDDQKDELQDMIGTMESPEEEYMDTELKEEILKCLDILTEQERVVIILAFGLNGKTEIPQKQIAKQLGVSEARVSDILRNAKRKLGNSSRVKELKDLLYR